MDLRTPISLVYSYKLALMDALSEKKQRNIKIAMITLNRRLTMCLIKLEGVDCVGLFNICTSWPPVAAVKSAMIAFIVSVSSLSVSLITNLLIFSSSIGS